MRNCTNTLVIVKRLTGFMRPSTPKPAGSRSVVFVHRISLTPHSFRVNVWGRMDEAEYTGATSAPLSL
jgi:hypothetical protein